MKKIAFVINFSKQSWTGGFTFYHNLISYLIKYTKKINILIITDNKKNIRFIKRNKKVKILETNLVSYKYFLKRIVDKFLIFFFGKSFFLENLLIRNKVDVLSHSTFLGKKSKIKSFPWFPDFQHLYFPENFLYKNILLKNLNVLLASKHSNSIILSSISVKKDIKKISDLAYKKSVVLYHANKVLDKKKLVKKNILFKKYGIKGRYFFLPNHYWIHKNHITVVKALTYLKNKKFQIISTGTEFDHRNKNHIDYLRNLIVKNNLQSRYKMLGLVPFRDLCSLMKYSIAIINPSLSEGWGNSADQARQFCKPCILSKISVHKELNYKYSYFFKPLNFKELSNILKLIYSKKFKIKKFDNEILEKNYIKNYLKIIQN